MCRPWVSYGPGVWAPGCATEGLMEFRCAGFMCVKGSGVWVVGGEMVKMCVGTWVWRGQVVHGILVVGGIRCVGVFGVDKSGVWSFFVWRGGGQGSGVWSHRAGGRTEICRTGPLSPLQQSFHQRWPHARHNKAVPSGGVGHNPAVPSNGERHNKAVASGSGGHNPAVPGGSVGHNQAVSSGSVGHNQAVPSATVGHNQAVQSGGVGHNQAVPSGSIGPQPSSVKWQCRTQPNGVKWQCRTQPSSAKW